MPFTRRFTAEAAGLRLVRRDVRIRSLDGRIVFEAEGIEVPETWSQLATDILASKYLHLESGERSARDAVGRIVGAIRDAGAKGGVLAGDSAAAFAADLTHILLTQKAAFNSPVWFNLGLHGRGVRGGDGQYVFEEGKVRVVGDGYERPQVSACFIQSLQDSLTGPGGIFDLLRREAHIFRHGSGTGTNFSVLRSRHERIQRGGTSSGVMSFLKVFDAAAGATKSGGTTRRAAKMVVLDADHPEISEFADWKRREEGKAQVLITAGYASDWEGEAYASVFGQHGNNSVRVPDAFMQAVVDDSEWSTTQRTDGAVVDSFPARRLWERIVQAAWACGDPGLQFQDTIARWHTCAASGPIRATNPCSEFVFLDDTACNLASINLLAYWDGERFDIEGFRHTVRILVTAMDILVDHAGYPTPDIARNSVRFRPLGLGYANLGALAMASGWPYDSDLARGMAAAITSLLTGAACLASAELAEHRGEFPAAGDTGEKATGAAPATSRESASAGAPVAAARPMPPGVPPTPGSAAPSGGPATEERTASRRSRAAAQARQASAANSDPATGATNRDHMRRVLRQHVEAAERVAEQGSPNDHVRAKLAPPWVEVARAGLESWQAAFDAGHWRNAQLTVIAPTGTIGLLMDCDTTGIEPELRLRTRKRLAGGGSTRLPNRAVGQALASLGYSLAAADAILAYVESNGTVEGSGLRDEHWPVFDTAFSSGASGRAIAPDGHLAMLAVVQPLLSGGISKTVNLPHDATVADVADVYMRAWRLGLKSIAVYRDGSKASQPLSGEGAGDAPPCPTCRHATERAGTCFRCTNCGTVLGCS